MQTVNFVFQLIDILPFMFKFDLTYINLFYSFIIHFETKNKRDGRPVSLINKMIDAYAKKTRISMLIHAFL